MIHPSGFNSDPAFQVGGEGVFRTGELYYTGGSQGGIIGGSLTAVPSQGSRTVSRTQPSWKNRR